MVWINKPIQKRISKSKSETNASAIHLLCVVEWCVVEDGCVIVGGGIPLPCTSKRK